MLKLVLPPDTPRLADVHLNWRVLAVHRRLSHSDRLRLRPRTGPARPAAAAADGARRRRPRRRRPVARRCGSALTIAQIACAVLLVIAAGLLVRSLWTLSHADPGFQPEQVVTARISPTESRLRDDRSAASPSTARSTTQLQATPGIGGAALVNTLPLTGAVAKRSLELEGFTSPASRAAPLFWLHVITPDYFRRDGHPPGVGPRLHARGSRRAPPVAIVTASTREGSGRTRTRSAGTSASSARRTGTPSSASSPTCARSISRGTSRAGSPARSTCRTGRRHDGGRPHSDRHDAALRTTLDSAQVAGDASPRRRGVSGDVVDRRRQADAIASSPMRSPRRRPRRRCW